MIPRATYRLQLHRGFPFSAVEAAVPYLAQLGVSHAYLSPIQTARVGSTHGYDVVDHGTINPELGGEDGFRRMAATLKAAGLGIILDIVPNHMAVGGHDNTWWLDVLRRGMASPYAGHFDIDFNPPDPALRGKVFAPFLGTPLDVVLSSGELKLKRWQKTGEWVLAYHEHVFPLRPEDQNLEPAGTERPEALRQILERQHYLLAFWREAGERINWRRFFDISSLAGLRIEEPRVFDAVHELILRLYQDELIDGVRVDHVDGLSDPAAYCRKLRGELVRRQGDRAPAYLVVEKILAFDEQLAEDWAVDGTTGYDFMNEASALQHDPAGHDVLSRFWHDVSGRSADFDPEECQARDEMLSAFGAQTVGAAAALSAWATASPLPTPTIHEALSGLIRRFRRYRTYATGRTDSPPEAAAPLVGGEMDTSSVSRGEALIGDAMNAIDSEDAVRKVNQLTAPIAAKAVEDTAFYRYGALVSRNDVGFDPRHFSLEIGEFHARTKDRAMRWPHAMLATATHDHKRGEDARARLAVISECPDRWIELVRDWFRLNRAHRGDIALGDEYLFYQSLVAVWPDLSEPIAEAELRSLAERLKQWRLKALREAKLKSSWAEPNASYEDACLAQVDGLLDARNSAPFLASVQAFVKDIGPAARANAIVQVALKHLVPGVPDTYQGTEQGDLSMVDPDNRREVSFDLRRSEPQTPKEDVLRRLLRLRRTQPNFFEKAGYRPLRVHGPRAQHVIAFERALGDDRMVVLAARRLLSLQGCGETQSQETWWGETLVEARLDQFQPVFPSTRHAARMADAFSGLPVQVLLSPGLGASLD